MKPLNLLVLVLLILAALSLGTVGGYFIGFDHGWEKAMRQADEQLIEALKNANIKSFQDCVNAGYPVMESFPEKCRTSDGRVFEKPVLVPTRPGGPLIDIGAEGTE